MSWKSLVLGLVVGALVTTASARLLVPPPPAKEGASPELSEREIADRCYLLLTNAASSFFDNRFLGIQTLQNPLDAWVTQEIIHETRPDFILDVGTRHGGSAALWASILEHVNPEGRIISIDVEDRVDAAARLPVVQRRVDFLIGSSTDPAIVAEVAERVQGRKVLAILDSLHTKEHVANELRAYSPLIGIGGYIIVQDTPLDRYTASSLEAEGYSEAMIASFDEWIRGRSFYPFFRKVRRRPGAGAGVAEFLEGNDDFVIDKTRERLLLTNNWNGYLKRVK
jgi:cephalosporin hydroxylase